MKRYTRKQRRTKKAFLKQQKRITHKQYRMRGGNGNEKEKNKTERTITNYSIPENELNQLAKVGEQQEVVTGIYPERKNGQVKVVTPRIHLQQLNNNSKVKINFKNPGAVPIEKKQINQRPLHVFTPIYLSPGTTTPTPFA